MLSVCSVGLLLKSTRRHKKRSCFSVNVRQFRILTAVWEQSRLCLLQVGATRSSGSVAALGLVCFSGPGYTTLAEWCAVLTARPLCSWVLWLTTGNRQNNCFLFWVCSYIIMKQDPWSRIVAPQKGSSTWMKIPYVADTSCKGNLIAILCESFFGCKRKGHLSVGFVSQVPASTGQFCSDVSPGTSALHSEQESGTAAMAPLSLLHHPS